MPARPALRGERLGNDLSYPALSGRYVAISDRYKDLAQNHERLAREMATLHDDVQLTLHPLRGTSNAGPPKLVHH